jgi:hypothetical protein
VKNAQLSDSDLVHEVFVRVRSGDLSVAELFAEDAVLFYENVRAEGRDAIRRFYQRTIEHVQPDPRVAALLESPPYFIALVDLPSKLGHLHAVDVFQLNGSQIRQLEIYIRPGQAVA